MKHLLPFRLIATLLLFPLLLNASITFNTKTVTIPYNNQKELTATFPFTADKDTTINTKSSCGCTVARLAKNTYKAGESGEIKAVFNVGSRKGPQRKTITVTTDDGKRQILTLKTEAITGRFSGYRVKFLPKDLSKKYKKLIQFHKDIKVWAFVK